MRIVQLNLALDPGLPTPGRLLDRYHTLTEWSRAVADAGADVQVVQRFSSDATVWFEGICYEFVADGRAGMPGPWARFPRVRDAVVRLAPDVVHVNGLMFPGMVRALRAGLPSSSAIVIQDHSGAMPRLLPWPLNLWPKTTWRRAFDAADAVSFTAAALAARWHAAGLPSHLPVLEIAEASTRFAPVDRVEARWRTSMTGSPAILWVGRLNANKDPLTVLNGIEAAAADLPDARLWMIVPEGECKALVARRIDASGTLRSRVTMIGATPRRDMPLFYSAADVFVSGSRHEGSGYALIEAMACGALPCVTDIPAFRALTASCGERWHAGDSAACAAALVRVARRATPVERARVRQMFDDRLSWRAIAAQTLDAYAAIASRRADA